MANTAASQGIVVASGLGLEVKGRRRLQDAAVFEAVLSELQTKLLSLTENGKVATISDLDVSQNHLTLEQFEMLFITLAASNVRVQRFRMFGCPTLNDEVMIRLISNHFQESLSPETAPSEMHLSDCAITAEGFNHFMGVIEESSLYPLKPPGSHGGHPVPLYLRLENNYIEEDAIQQKIDSGLIRPFSKKVGKPMTFPEGLKVDLVHMPDKPGFQQRQGPPPAPKDAPPPRQVKDKFEEERQQAEAQRQAGVSSQVNAARAQQWGGSAWQGQAHSAQQQSWGSQQTWGQQTWPQPQQTQTWQQPQQAWQQPQQAWQQPQQAWQQPQWAAVPMQACGGHSVPAQTRPMVAVGHAHVAAATARPFVRPPFSGEAGNVRRAAVTAAKPVENAQVAAQAQQVNGGGKGASRSGGSAGSAADRSRTPAPRTSKGEPGQAPLPHPWEEHWSEDFNIPYFWNTVTGESEWERPKA